MHFTTKLAQERAQLPKKARGSDIINFLRKRGASKDEIDYYLHYADETHRLRPDILYSTSEDISIPTIAGAQPEIIELSGKKAQHKSYSLQDTKTVPNSYTEIIVRLPELKTGRESHYGDLFKGKGIGWIRYNHRIVDNKRVMRIEEIQPADSVKDYIKKRGPWRPFTNPKAFYRFMLKIAIGIAVAERADAIDWISGEQTASRWHQLGEQVQRIEAKIPKSVNTVSPKTRIHLTAVATNGQERTVSVYGERLEEYVGERAAIDLLEQLNKNINWKKEGITYTVEKSDALLSLTPAEKKKIARLHKAMWNTHNFYYAVQQLIPQSLLDNILTALDDDTAKKLTSKKEKIIAAILQGDETIQQQHWRQATSQNVSQLEAQTIKNWAHGMQWLFKQLSNRSRVADSVETIFQRILAILTKKRKTYTAYWQHSGDVITSAKSLPTLRNNVYEIVTGNVRGQASLQFDTPRYISTSKLITLYNRDLPAAASKLIKKYDSKVQPIEETIAHNVTSLNLGFIITPKMRQAFRKTAAEPQLLFNPYQHKSRKRKR